jgi:hypothetical protein
VLEREDEAKELVTGSYHFLQPTLVHSDRGAPLVSNNRQTPQLKSFQAATEGNNIRFLL